MGINSFFEFDRVTCSCDRCNGRPFEVPKVPEGMKHLFPELPPDEQVAKDYYRLLGCDVVLA